MSKVFNMVGGGGGKNISSIIITGLLSTDTVACINDGKSYTATWDETAKHWEIVGLPLGTFTITATNEINTCTETILIDIVGVYEITMNIPYYGDGSLNTVTNGYDGKLLENGYALSPKTCTYSTGNLNVYPYENSIKNGMVDVGSSWNKISAVNSGTNSYPLTWNAGDNELSVFLGIMGGGSGFGSNNQYLSGLKFTCDGEQKTLSDLVLCGAIKPMVLIMASADVQYYYPSPLNMYTGDSTGNKNWSDFQCYFIINKGHSITAVSFYSYGSTINGGEGVWEISADRELYCISVVRE